MKNRNTHAMLLTLVGAYMLYTAWHLFENMRSGAQEMPAAAYIALIVLFALAGVGIFVYAFIIWRGSRREEDKKSRDEDGAGNDQL